MRGRLLTVIVAGFLVGALGGAALLALSQGPAGPAVQTTGKALIGGPFTLVDQNGKTVTDQDFRGRYMLVFFGFTHCPDVCPAELQVMSASLDELGPQADEIVPIFITLDPERDTPAAMGAYVKNFGPRFLGLTGSPEAISAAAKSYRIAYSKFREDEKSDDYSIDHSALVYLMGKDGEYITHFAHGTPAWKMTEILRRYF
ncbi:MAG TPA: SCO family protein [Methyloceanibacter sp.]|jgi:protein SCO1/2|nr:SCO family protein [Methyloceanibacter sp.]